MQKGLESYTGFSAVKPPILKSPLQTRRFAWRRSYARPVILDTEHRTEFEPLKGFYGAISFAMTNLPATPLE
jgi:hypothetical protein